MTALSRCQTSHKLDRILQCSALSSLESCDAFPFDRFPTIPPKFRSSNEAEANQHVKFECRVVKSCRVVECRQYTVRFLNRAHPINHAPRGVIVSVGTCGPFSPSSPWIWLMLVRPVEPRILIKASNLRPENVSI